MMPFLLVFIEQQAWTAEGGRCDGAGDDTMKRLVKITGVWFHYL
jgi:hypothetical protein